MAKKKKKTDVKKLLHKMDKAIQRQVAIDKGFYNRPNVRPHKDKTAYSRKDKHRKPPDKE